MRVRIRVNNSLALAGYTEARARLQIMPGEYNVDFSAIVGQPGDGKLDVAHFQGANTYDGKPLAVRRDEFEEVWEAPQGKGGKGWDVI